MADYPISALQDRAPMIVREASAGPVGITRYGRTVAALISPEQLAALRELEDAAERALWLLDAERAFGDLARGDVENWDVVAADLKRRYAKKR